MKKRKKQKKQKSAYRRWCDLHGLFYFNIWNWAEYQRYTLDNLLEDVEENEVDDDEKLSKDFESSDYADPKNFTEDGLYIPKI